MCRIGDQGAYEPSNVFVQSAPKNASDAHKNGRKLTKRKNYLWAGEEIDIYTLREHIKAMPGRQINHFRKDCYQAENIRETQRLITRYKFYTPHTHQRMWTTHDEPMPSVQEAADHMGLTKSQYLWRQHIGEVKMIRICLGLTLTQYIMQHHRWPDPWLPSDLAQQEAEMLR